VYIVITEYDDVVSRGEFSGVWAHFGSPLPMTTSFDFGCITIRKWPALKGFISLIFAV
jgi:hypothetical protein